jgi:hypothetical protein
MSFCTPGQVDDEPPSVADNLRECAAASPRAYQAAVDADVVDIVSIVDASRVTWTKSKSHGGIALTDVVDDFDEVATS